MSESNQVELLIVDDQARFAQECAALLAPQIRCRHVLTGEEALGEMQQHPPDAVLLDIYIEIDGARTGLEILPRMHARFPTIPIIVVTQDPTAQTRAMALENGALDYLAKQADRSEMLAVIQKCIAMGRAARERELLNREQERLRELAGLAQGGWIESQAPVMHAFLDGLRRAAAAPQSIVLLLGESGTGKTVFARELHRLSPRAKGPFVERTIDPLCDGGVIRGELFGTRQGAFTDAVDRLGIFELAAEGTLFLDEIGNLPLSVQGALLRVIESRQFEAVGGHQSLAFRARLVVATNKDLDREVAAGHFRTDLLERLRVVSLRVPALRERGEDLPDLIRFFKGFYQRQLNLPAVEITEEAMAHLLGHSWQANNVRELRSTIERALVLHGHEQSLRPTHFDVKSAAPGSPPPASSPPTAPMVHNGAGAASFDYHAERKRAMLQFKTWFYTRAIDHIGAVAGHIRPEDIKKLVDLTGRQAPVVRRHLDETGLR